MPTINYEHGKAIVQALFLEVQCNVCLIVTRYERKHLSISHVSNDGKRGGVYFTLQCPNCQVWHTEVTLYQSV